MNYNIIPTSRFEKEIKRLLKKFPSLRNEFAILIQNIEKKPNFGTFISNNCYKIRIPIASKGKGKSGGARVITHVYISNETVYLLTIYDKSEKQNLKPKELKEMLDSLEL